MQDLILRSTRLLLREMQEHDLPEITAMLAEPEQVRYIEFEANESSARCLLDWSLRTAQEHPRSAYSLALTFPPENKLIGTCSLVIRDMELREGDLGFILDRRYQGNGLAAEAVGQSLLRFGFEQLGLHRICAVCNPDNKASIRTIEKTGLRREAHFREAHWEKGRWNDRLVYATLDHEWKARL